MTDFDWSHTPLFASPVFKVRLDGAEAARDIFEREIEGQTPAELIDCHGPMTHYYSQGNVFDAVPALSELREHIEAAASFTYRRLMHHTASGPLRIINAWFNRCEIGGEQAAHNHGNCLLSGTLYLQADDNTHLTFFHPLLNPSFHAELFDQAGDEPHAFGLDYHTREQDIPVSTGDCLFWPPALQHGYGPNETPGRLSLSFNLMPTYVNVDYQVQIKP